VTGRIRRFLRAGFPRAAPLQARIEFWELARTMTPYLAAENRGDVYIVPTSAGGGIFVRNARRAEFVCLERACAILRDRGRQDGDVFVDVGAHIGTSLIPALTQHGFSRGVAIEPDPDNLRLLRANLAVNGLDTKVAVVHAAVSDAPGRLWFQAGRARGGWTRGQLEREPLPGAEPVDVVTLDSLATLGVVDPAATGLLWLGKWLDVAGFLAASAFLVRRVPIVLVLRRGWLSESSTLVRELITNGYRHVVDLRRPSLDEPLAEWPRSLRPIEELPAITPRKRITDVLVFDLAALLIDVAVAMARFDVGLLPA
jgi:FkbM family methyltransferase